MATENNAPAEADEQRVAAVALPTGPVTWAAIGAYWDAREAATLDEVNRVLANHGSVLKQHEEGLNGLQGRYDPRLAGANAPGAEWRGNAGGGATFVSILGTVHPKSRQT